MADVRFQIRQAALETIVADARAAWPAECCGLLLGTSPSIDEAVPAKNLARSRTRFLIDPHDHISALRAARARGVDLLGFYHSHPETPAWPSPTDVEEAAYADAVYLIVSLATEQVDVRLFRIESAAVTEVPLVHAP